MFSNYKHSNFKIGIAFVRESMGKYETKLSNKMSAGHFSDCSILKSWIKSRKGYLIAFTNNVLQSLEGLPKNNWGLPKIIEFLASIKA